MNALLRGLVAAASVWLVATDICAAEKKPLSNTDVIKMLKADLPESTVILAIQNSTPAFDTSPDGLIALKTAGVSAAVIDAMLQARQPVPEPPPDAPTEAEVEEMIGKLATEQSNRVVSLAAFKKIDGQSSQANAVKSYKMDFDAYVTFSANCVWTSVYMNLEKRLGFRVANRPQNSRNVTEQLLNQVSAADGHHVDRGAVFVIRGRALLEKAESGWRPVQLTYESIQPSTAQAAANVRGGRNVSRLRTALSVTQQDLAGLVARSLEPPSIPYQAFTSTNGLVSAKYPTGFRLEKPHGTLVGRFVLADRQVPPDAITLQCAKLPAEQSLEQTIAATKEFIGKQHPGATFTETVQTTLAGAEAQVFAMTVIEENTLKQKATTLAICQGHLVGVVLHTTPARFAGMWDTYRRVCESYVLNSK